VERREQFDHSAGIRQTLGHIAMMQGDLETAVKEFTDARFLSPENQGIAEDLARALFETRRFADAEGILTKVLADAANKDRRDLQLMQANCFAKLDRLSDSRDVLMRLTQDAAGSRDVEAFVALGNVSFMMKDMVRVRQTASRLIAIAPKRAEGYLLRSLHMRHAGDFTNAETSARQAIDLGGGAEAWTLLGMIQEESGKTAEAKDSFAKAEELGANAPDTTAGAGAPVEME
jgi:Flp pilus assembly protein TadD